MSFFKLGFSSKSLRRAAFVSVSMAALVLLAFPIAAQDATAAATPEASAAATTAATSEATEAATTAATAAATAAATSGSVAATATPSGAAAATATIASPASDSSSITGTLSVQGFGTGDEIATTRVTYAEESYPGLQVTINNGAFDPQQFLTAVASGSPPDLVYMDRQTLSTYAVNGAIVPLTDCISNESIDMTQYRKPAVDQVTVNGVVYGIPEFYNSVVLIANTKALSDAGMTIDQLDTSNWDTISKFNDATTTGSGNTLSRIGFDPKLPEFLPLWAAANGVSILSADGKKAQLNDPKVVEALNFAVSLLKPAGGWAPFKAFRDTWDFFGAKNQVVSNQVGAWPMEQWYVDFLAGVSPDAPVAVTAFKDRQGNPITFTTGSAWAIPKGSKNPAGACAFAKAMTSVGAWVAAAQARATLRKANNTINTGVYTGNAKADDQIFNGIVPHDDSNVWGHAVNVILQVQQNPTVIPANPAGAEFQTAWQDAVNRVLNGQQSVEDALNQAQQEAQAALDAAWSSQPSS